MDKKDEKFEKHPMSRRDFLKSAAVGTIGIGVMGLAGCGASPSKAAPSPSANPVPGTNATAYSFEVPPVPVADSKITKTNGCDILIVGAGIAGLCLACRAAELSKGKDKIILISASTKHVERGGSFHGINTKVQKEYGVEYSIDKALGKSMKQEYLCGSYLQDMRKWSRWITNSEDSMNWLIDKMTSYGAEVTLEMPFKDPEGILDFPAGAHNFILRDESKTKKNGGIFSTTTTWGAITGAILVGDMYQYEFEKLSGSRIDWSTKAEYLIRENNNTGRVTGLVATNADGKYVKYNASKAVVLATGDFSTNKEMMEKYCGWVDNADLLYYKGTNYDNCNVMGGVMPGDGQKMGLWAGAAWQKMPCAPNIVAIAGPQSRANASPATIMLNKDGKRFMNEDTTMCYSAYTTMNQRDKTIYEIWDVDYAHHYDEWIGYGVTLPMSDGFRGCDFLYRKPDDMLKVWNDGVKDGKYYKADTLENLVGQLAKDGLNSDEALKSISNYNAYCDADFDPEYLKDASELTPIKKGPFYAFKLCLSAENFLTVHGGLRTNEYMQVCDKADTPIEGLYNIGVMTGGMFSNIYTFNVAGQSLGATCTTFPYLLAKDLVESKKS